MPLHEAEHVIEETLKQHSIPLKTAEQLDLLLDKTGDTKYVLLGESTHGTHEFYTWRTEITKRLIKAGKCSFIAVEGDWPDCYRLNRYVKGYQESENTAFDVLNSFHRWPTWMWANWEIVALAEWLREYNKTLPMEQRVGFYGIDVYSLWESLHQILSYLQEKQDPELLDKAKRAFSCFEPFGEEHGLSYARALRMLPVSCEEEVIHLFQSLLEKQEQFTEDPEAVFAVQQNARIAVQAEKYYRTMIRANIDSWNIRDEHMTETILRLMEFHEDDARCVVWEHNTHLGDARATTMGNVGEVNVGQLLREQAGEKNVFIVGFGTYAGHVVAASGWGEPMEDMTVPPARKHSWEDLLHSAGNGNNLLLFPPEFQNDFNLMSPIEQRAIGVVYDPSFESLGNYVPSILPQRYDAFLFINKTTALHPLHIEPEGAEMPETYPFGV